MLHILLNCQAIKGIKQHVPQFAPPVIEKDVKINGA